MVINVTAPPKEVFLGQQCENNFRELDIDWSAWKTAWPNGTLSVVIRRYDGATHVAATDVDTSPYVWTVDAQSVAVAGRGELELRVTGNGFAGKSTIIKTLVAKSIVGGTEPGALAPDWTATVIAAAQTATAAKTAAETAMLAAEGAKAGAETAQGAAEAAVGKTSYVGENGNWYEWDSEAEAFVDSGVPATGPRGYTGANLEFEWDGTSLGIRVEGDTEYQHVNLKGDKGDKGDTGTPSGFGTPTATANTLAAGESATAAVVASGDATAKIFAFTFGVPQGLRGYSAYDQAVTGGYNGSEAAFLSDLAAIEGLAAELEALL